KMPPNNLFLENIINNINPITVGGKTIGNIIILSIIGRILPLYLCINFARKIPNMHTIIVLINDTLIDFHSCVKSVIIYLLFIKVIIFIYLFGFFSFYEFIPFFCFFIIRYKTCSINNRSV